MTAAKPSKVQKKKEAEKAAKARRAFLESLDAPLITVHSPGLELAMGKATSSEATR